MGASTKFEEHERSVRVIRGAAENNSNFLSALQTSHVYPYHDISTVKSMNQLFYNIATNTRVLFNKLTSVFHAFMQHCQSSCGKQKFYKTKVILILFTLFMVGL